MSDPKLSFERDDTVAPNTLVYRLHGVLGETDRCYQFLDEVRSEAGAANDHALIVFNLADVEYMTSAGIGIVAACHTSARKANKSLVLAGAAPAVVKVLDLTGVGALVRSFPTEQAAISG